MDERFWDEGFAGDIKDWAARAIHRDLLHSGFQLYTVGQDVSVEPHRAFASLMGRFHRPRFVDPTTYERQFAQRIVDEIHGAGLEIRPA
jgi:hypothetical protein